MRSTTRSHLNVPRLPLPRLANGKPDLSGLWLPEVNPYRFDVVQDPKDEGIFRPAAEAIFMERVVDFRRDDPVTNCLPGGPSEILNQMYRIIQSPTVVALLFESGTGRYRQIYVDGRKLPNDPNPTWLGYSVGSWDGDVFVVQSSGYSDRSWLDGIGHARSEATRITERIRRPDFGHLEVDVTIDDPRTYTRPFSIRYAQTLVPDTDILEYICAENEKDRAHLAGQK
jgi:hypothetical protein